VKIPFPALDHQKATRETTQKRNTAKRRSSLRKLLTSLHHHGHSKKKTNAEKVELYLQQCLLDPVVSQSSIVRDFLSIQRDEDQKLPTKSVGDNNDSSHDSVTFSDPDSSNEVPSTATTPPVARRTTQSDAAQPKSSSDDQQQQVPDTRTHNESSSAVAPQQQQHPREKATIADDVNDSQMVPRSLSVKSDMVSLRDLLRESASPPPIPVMDSPLQAPSSPQAQDQPSVAQPFPLDYFEMMTVLGKGCMGKVTILYLYMT
jgi:hypothetical protein